MRGVWFGILSTSQILSLGLFCGGLSLAAFLYLHKVPENLMFEERRIYTNDSDHMARYTEQ